MATSMPIAAPIQDSIALKPGDCAPPYRYELPWRLHYQVTLNMRNQESRLSHFESHAYRSVRPNSILLASSSPPEIGRGRVYYLISRLLSRCPWHKACFCLDAAVIVCPPSGPEYCLPQRVPSL